MKSLEVTQKVLAIGPTYQVRVPGNDQVLWTVKGKLLSATPKLIMTQGDTEVAVMKANFLKTKFEISVGGKVVANLAFPLIAFKKSFTLETNGKTIKAEGGILGRGFEAKSASGQTALAIKKNMSLKDSFQVDLDNAELPDEIAVMAAVAIDQKFFEESPLLDNA